MNLNSLKRNESSTFKLFGENPEGLIMSDEKSKPEVVVCARCGQRAAYSRGWLNDDENNFLCNSCYLNSFFPGLREYYREMIDNGLLPVKFDFS